MNTTEQEEFNLTNNNIHLLCNYRTHLMRQLQRYKDKYCTYCFDELSLENASTELSLLNAHIYSVCDHKWSNDYIEINEEMHKIVFCDVCHSKKQD